MLNQETIHELLNVKYKIKRKEKEKSKQWQGFIFYTSGGKKEINTKITIRFFLIVLNFKSLKSY